MRCSMSDKANLTDLSWNRCIFFDQLIRHPTETIQPTWYLTDTLFNRNRSTDTFKPVQSTTTDRADDEPTWCSITDRVSLTDSSLNRCSIRPSTDTPFNRDH